MLYLKPKHWQTSKRVKNKILAFQFSYLPGYKAGGSLRTLANLVEYLGDEFELKVVCSDRDSGEASPYRGIKVDQWQAWGKAEVLYLSPGNLNRDSFRKVILDIKPDVIYLNSFFHRIFSRQPLLLRRLGQIPKIPFIIAPRGEFSKGAIKLKKSKKYLYVFLAKLFGLVTGIVWHASNEQEANDIRRLFGRKTQVMIAPDLPTKFSETDLRNRDRKKEKGQLKVVFLSRISRKKNLTGALIMLQGLKGKIQFNIYGPIDDARYWRECQDIIKDLPENIRASYFGEVEYQDVVNVFQQHDLFFMPTFGENFGYVYLEALVAGCPILLSDQTPWKDLKEKGVGWDIPLSQKEMFKNILQQCVDMSPKEYQLWSDRARQYGLTLIDDKAALAQHKIMFYDILKKNNARK